MSKCVFDIRGRLEKLAMVDDNSFSPIEEITILGRGKEMKELECICKGNWRNLVKEYDHLIGRKFRDKDDGKKYIFFGLVHSDDDYYYGLARKGKLVLASCVGDMEEYYELIEDKK